MVKAVILLALGLVSSEAFINAALPNAGRGSCRENKVSMAVTLPPLPYGYTDLEPYVSKTTLEFHHDKHHAKYVTVTNEMIKGTDLENASLEEIVVKAKSTGNQGLFNNAAQSWNHAFYWSCMKKGGGGKPTGKIAEAIDKAFGSYDNFRKEFVTAANTAFGSGWAWLVADKSGNLKVVKTIGADLPVTDGLTPLLTCDVWEHAYYLDYQNVRAKYVDTFMDSLVNWDFVNSNFKA